MFNPSLLMREAGRHYQADGEPPDVRALDLRMFFPQELNALLSFAGFTIEAKYGGFDGSVFASAARRQRVLCRKAV